MKTSLSTSKRIYTFVRATTNITIAFSWLRIRQYIKGVPKSARTSITTTASELLPRDITLTIRRLPSESVPIQSQKKLKVKLGIVLQGPYISTRNFTLETALMYTRIFPGSLVVIATWKESFPQRDFEILKEAGVEVLTLEDTESETPCNEDLQAKSSHAGLTHMKNMGVKWVLKTRCDMRIHDPSALLKMRDIVTFFPLAKKYPNQKHRIIGLDRNTRKFIPYSLSDTLLFGYTSDLIAYFAPLSDHDVYNLNKKFQIQSSHMTIEEFAKLESGEHFFCVRFLRQSREAIEWTVLNWWDVMARRFSIVNGSEIDVYWFKSKMKENWFFDYPTSITEIFFSQIDWLRCHFKKNSISKRESQKLVSKTIKRMD